MTKAAVVSDELHVMDEVEERVEGVMERLEEADERKEGYETSIARDTRYLALVACNPRGADVLCRYRLYIVVSQRRQIIIQS